MRHSYNMSTEDQSEAVEGYLRELVEVGKRHGFVLGHEDSHGGFLVVPRGTDTHKRYEAMGDMDEWLLEAREVAAVQ